ncbi:MAG: GTPase Era [Oscillospiraceae bacterium]|nr:GTPase Era [Oscillospiraceae bacterium]
MSTKSVFVTIVGRPNVGKSSLLNVFVGEKVAIVSPKPQTTRMRITGVLTKNEIQLVFIDTPGMHKPRTKLGEHMVKQINSSVADVDVAILMTEASGEIRSSEINLMESFKAKKIPAVLAVNKIDTLKQKEQMMDKILKFSELFKFDEIVPISVLKRDGVDILLSIIERYAKPAPHFFDGDDYTDQTERAIISEMVREKVLMNMNDEIPHGTVVEIEEMKERENGEIADIRAVIYCEKQSHKAMIIGKNGERLKKIGSQARVEIERLLGLKVNLQCWVKVRQDWRNSAGNLRQFGFQ